jgi:predicted O-methyltransferase YrrM
MTDNFKYSEKYRFTEEWFDAMIPLWTDLFKQYKQQVGKISNVLEIGCYEGRATIWLCENVLNNLDETYTYDVVDTFGGSVIESGMKQAMSILAEDENSLENTFRHNISYHNHINFNIHKGMSQKILPTFDPTPRYDFIYIDASHRADDTFVDAYYAYKMLKTGGLLVFDDYGWKDGTNMHINNSPQLGVDMFKAMYDNELQQVFSGYQVGFVKII